MFRGHAIRERAKCLHAEFDIIDPAWFHSFDVGLRHPFRAHAAAHTFSDLRVRRNVMANRILGGIPVMQIGKTFVPILAVAPVQIETRDNRPIGLDGHLDLEGKRRVLPVIFLGGRAAIDDKQGNHMDIGSGAPGFGRSGETDHLETVTVGHLERSRGAVGSNG